jgi:protein-L-isoaspartate O-methyltransferase
MENLTGLVSRLAKRGLLVSADAKEAFRSVDPAEFVLPPYRLLAYEDTPVPYYEGDVVGLLPSRRLAATLLQLIIPDQDGDVVLYGSDGGYLAALLVRSSPGRSVVVVEEEELLAEATVKNLERAGVLDVRVEGEMSQEGAAWLCVLRPELYEDPGLRKHLVEMGTLLTARKGSRGHELVQIVRSGDEFGELAIREAALGGPGGGTHAVNVASLLAIEDLLAHVWTGGTSARDGHLRELAESTFEGGPWDDGMLELDEVGHSRVARTVFRLAHIHQMMGDLENAERLYLRSLEAFPTSEAHTFLGWTYSFLNRLEDAMRECRRAIDVDPTLGNPYNDIGAYLIELGRADEAIPWLKRATEAERYCCPFYAHCNLGRVYMLRGDLVAAREAFARALDANPEYDLARQLLGEVERHL